MHNFFIMTFFNYHIITGGKKSIFHLVHFMRLSKQIYKIIYSAINHHFKTTIVIIILVSAISGY